MIDEGAITRRLILDEGEVLHVYWDSLGFATLGVGRLVDERKGGGITQDESRYMLRNDIHRKISECDARFEWWPLVDSVRQQVLICMAFQLGVEGVTGFHDMCAALARGDYVRASIEMLNSTWARQTPARAQRMAKIMHSGVWE